LNAEKVSPQMDEQPDFVVSISVTDTDIFKLMLQLIGTVYRRTRENETKLMIKNWLDVVLDDRFDVDRILRGR